MVLKRYAELGELQSPGKEVLKVAALENNLVVSVALTGEEISLVHLNQKVKVHLAYAGIVDGKISKIPAIADSNTHLFTIEVSLTDGKLTESMIAGQLAKILIHAQVKDFVYRLPIDALISVDDNGKAIILTQNDSGNGFEHRYFDIHKIDNQFVYLSASSHETTLQVVVRGWQHIQVEK